MISIFIYFLLISLSNQWICDFDSGEKCLLGLPSASTILLNQGDEAPRQPASDVTSIQIFNNQGECFFPFPLGSFQMYFCQKSNPNLPSTCPTSTATGPRINCNEGQYGCEKFDRGERGSRSYRLDSLRNLSIGDHCLRFYYYLSDGMSNSRIKVLLENNQTNVNETISITSLYMGNKWHQIRENFRISDLVSRIFFVFEKDSSSSIPYYIGIDEISLIDLFCVPITTTAENTSTSSVSSTVRTSMSTVGISTSTSPLTNILSSSIQLSVVIIMHFNGFF